MFLNKDYSNLVFRINRSRESRRKRYVEIVDLYFDGLIQQETEPWYIFTKVYDTRVASIVFLVLGIIFIAIGTSILALVNNIYISEIYDITNSNVTEVTFNLPVDLEPPINLNIHIENFFQNFRSYFLSRTPLIYFGYSCREANTVQYARLIRGNTLDNYLNNIPGANNATESSPPIPLFPCGLTSIAFYNDKISLVKVGGVTVPIGTSDLALSDNLYMFFTKTEGITPWIDTMDPHFRVWMQSAFLPNFKMVWGRINVKLLKGEYKFTIENHWPASLFKAKKYISIEKTAFFGSKNAFLGWAVVFFGILLLMTSIIIFFLPRLKAAVDAKEKLIDAVCDLSSVSTSNGSPLN